jgi:hypothetical protein
MMRIFGVGMLSLGLAACATQPQGAASQPDGGAAVLAVVGAPFLIIAKVPTCLLTLVVAGPIGAVAQVSDPDDGLGHDVRQGLADGIDQNCGPPYVVTP